MTNTNDLLQNAAAYHANFTRGDLPLGAKRKLVVVTCMDARIDPFALLGLQTGDAHILRNAGGVATDDVIRSLAISQHIQQTTHVMLIHHTDCGMLGLTEDGFRAEIRERGGVRRPGRSRPSPTSKPTFASRSRGSRRARSCRAKKTCTATPTTCTTARCARSPRIPGTQSPLTPHRPRAASPGALPRSRPLAVRATPLQPPRPGPWIAKDRQDGIRA